MLYSVVRIGEEGRARSRLWVSVKRVQLGCRYYDRYCNIFRISYAYLLLGFKFFSRRRSVRTDRG